MRNTKKVFASTLLATSIAIGSVPFSSIGSPEVLAAAAQQEDKVVSYAKSLKGAPYKAGGTTKKGFDASGYVQHVYQKFEVKLPRTSKDMFKTGQTAKTLAPGDLVFYDTTNKKKKEVNYVGIYIGNQQFISVTSKKGVSIQNMKDAYWKTKYMGAKKAPVIGNEFSLDKVKNGDVIAGMKINSILIPHEAPQWPTRVIFEGKATISGTVSINKNIADAYTFVPDTASLKKLPVLKNKKGKSVITFEDQVAAKSILGKIKDKQKATIIIDQYIIHFKGDDIWKTAKIIKLVK